MGGMELASACFSLFLCMNSVSVSEGIVYIYVLSGAHGHCEEKSILKGTVIADTSEECLTYDQAIVRIITFFQNNQYASFLAYR